MMRSEPDPASVSAALDLLLDAMHPEQRPHATAFLLGELERLYHSAGIATPHWISVLRE